MISFNRTTEYAFRIMSHMALDRDKIYRSDDIYEDLKIPFRYLRRLLTLLSKKGLLVSIQGKYGGFRLEKKLSEISLYDIVVAVDEDKKPKECFFGYEKCPINEKCSMHDKWKSIRFAIDEVLTKTTLKDLIENGNNDFSKLLEFNKD